MKNHLTNQKSVVPIVIILIIIGVLGIAGGGIYYWQTQKNKQKLPEAKISEDWKTYRNEKYGFEFIFYEDYKGFWSNTVKESVVESVEEKEDLVATIGFLMTNLQDRNRNWQDKQVFNIHIFNRNWWDKNTEIENGFAWIKGKRGLQGALGVYLDKNDKFVFTLWENKQSCPDLTLEGPGPICKLLKTKPIDKMILNSFKVYQKPAYQEPSPMEAPKTKTQLIKFDLPAETPLNNENLKLSSFYGSIDVSSQDIKSYKILSVEITDSKAGQLLMLSKDLDSGKIKYNFLIYIEKTSGVYPINIMSIAKGLVWSNPLMIFQDKSIKPLLMERISNDNLFKITIYTELKYLIKTKPEEVGGDFQGERGKRLIKLITTVIENNLQKKAEETKVPLTYYDCQESNTCLAEKARNCELAKGRIKNTMGTIEHIINGKENDKCLYSSKILESNFGFAGLEIQCKLKPDILEKFFTDISSIDKETVINNCTGSYVDFMKKQSR